MNDWYNYRLWRSTQPSPSRGVRRRLTRPSVIEEAQMGDEREEEVKEAPPKEEQDTFLDDIF